MKFFYEERQQALESHYGEQLSDVPHLHNHLELVYMIEGEAIAYADGQACPLHSGELFLSFPNQVHYYQHLQKDRLILSIFSPTVFPEFSSLFSHSLPASPVLKEAGRIPRLVELLKLAVAINEAEGLYGDFERRGVYLAMLSLLFQNMTFLPAPATNNDVVRDVLLYCGNHYTGDLQLETVAAALHVNKYYISHLFTQKLQMKLNEYVGMLRVSASLPLLDSGKQSITDIAYSVGFNSTRSFNRLFLKYTGTTPRAYRAMKPENRRMTMSF